jgi:hypothetical protein
VQLATAQLFEAIAAQDILHSKPEQRLALTQLLQVGRFTDNDGYNLNVQFHFDQYIATGFMFCITNCNLLTCMASQSSGWRLHSCCRWGNTCTVICNPFVTITVCCIYP